jgi:hypothetical protein
LCGSIMIELVSCLYNQYIVLLFAVYTIYRFLRQEKSICNIMLYAGINSRQ